MTILLTVVLPQPLSPTSPRHSPRLIEKLTSLTARTVPAVVLVKMPAFLMRKLLSIWSTFRSGPALSASAGQGALSSISRPVSALISRSGTSRSPGFMSNRGTARMSAFR